MSEEKQVERPLEPNIRRWAIRGALAVAVAEVVYGLVVWLFFRGWPTAGQFGDMFGAFNALVTGLVLPGALYAIYVQLEEAKGARKDHEESLAAASEHHEASLAAAREQVKELQKQLERQIRRDTVEAGPFFRLTDAGQSGGELELRLKNDGAPVICDHFMTQTAGVSIGRWYPRTLSTQVEFLAKVNFRAGSPPQLWEFAMVIRDRWGTTRIFELRLKTSLSEPPSLDFWDRSMPPTQMVFPEGAS